MPQQIRVVQCIQCKMYQVDFVKKANTWQCKVCRQNQNLLKEFFRGSAAECRVKVQHLNLKRGMQEDRLNGLFLTAKEQLQAEEDCLENDENTTPQKNVNKWANYVDEPLEKSAVEPRITEEMSDEISMDFRKTRRTEARSFKRSAENMPSANKKSCSRWSDFL
ncbi:MRN complex-interacting protein [Drosophila santomea]|uniref:MRN complex-interacting protein n=1 Tax=Drosophila santomea TaxID=129105 RepID=UPI001CCA9485|nr:MRN complex-interacting protein [Drosophila santomea]